MELTKSQSRNLRKTIASSSGPIPADQLTLLQEYRTSYRHDLSSVFAELQKICAICTGKSILTFRLKRIESIISKIRRYPTMELTAIGDIAGCRIILNKAKDIDRVCSQIESDAYFVVKKEKDYVKNTKDSGYRSVHYIVHLPDSKKRIEVQVRTCGQHNWATFVETIDFLYGIKVKESIDDGSVKYEDFIKLHNNLSGCFEGIMPLTYEGKKEVIDTVHKYDVLGTLIEKFCDNYLRVREQWLNMLEESNLFLIQAFVDRPPLIMGFSDFELAESAYFNFYKDGFDGNMVIARIPDATYDDIRSAYPSYILTHHAFFETYFSIFEKFLKESVVNSSLTHTIRYYILYNKPLVSKEK